MAKITMEFDSVDKTWSVKQDGRVLDNVIGLSVYNMKDYSGDEEYGCCSINMMSEDETSDIKTYQQLSCSEKETGKAEFPEHKILGGFVIKGNQSPVSGKISDYLSNCWK